VRILVLITIFSALFGCAGLETNNKTSPVDEALKFCGFGYNSELGGMLEASYKYADKSDSSAEFGAKLEKGLETQLSAMVKNETFTEKLGEGEMLQLLREQQQCAKDYLINSRPNTRKDLLKVCMDDLQERLAGNGSRRKVVSVRNYLVYASHSMHSEESPVVALTIDDVVSERNIMVRCISNNNAYQDLEVVKNEG